MSPPKEKNQQVFIVTHESSSGKDWTHWLCQQGYEVSYFGGGQTALEQTEEQVPSLVVLDLYLQEPSGIDVLRSLREQGFKGKVLVLGGMSVSPLIPEALHLGIDGVLWHAPDRGHLECAIRFAIGGPNLESPSSRQQDDRAVAQT